MELISFKLLLVQKGEYRTLSPKHRHQVPFETPLGIWDICPMLADMTQDLQKAHAFLDWQLGQPRSSETATKLQYLN